MDRRIAAILAADMVGFSRLVELDEANVIARQRLHMNELIRPAIESARGRVVKTTGDGLLAEFPSVVDAVRCAVDIQKEMTAREEDQPGDRRIQYRIAVNLGDVIFEDDDVYGDGVNIAARLEALAEPGGIVVSGEAYDHLKTKAGVGFRSLGSQQLKNIATPVRVYHVMDEGAVLPATPKKRKVAFVAVATAAVVLVAAGGGAFWWMGRPDVTPADADQMKYTLSDKPSIAVLPFSNLDPNAEKSVLEDGLTMDLITELSRSRSYMVIAQHSMFEFQDKEVSPAEVAETLGVRYVVEGNLQQSEDNLQINVHLIDALSGNLVWAEKYRRPMADFFEIQDDMSSNIAAILSSDYGLVAQTELRKAKRKTASDLNTYELTLLANELHHQYSKENNQEALKLLNRVIELDPDYAYAHEARAWIYYHEATNDWTIDEEEASQKALEDARRATLLDPESALAHYSLGGVQMWLFGEQDEGVAAFERALQLEPNNADLMAVWGGWVLPELGREQEGLEIAKEAIRLNPYHGDWYNRAMQYVTFAVKDYDQAMFYYDATEYPLGNSGMIYVASLAQVGRMEEAREEAAKILEENPDFSVTSEKNVGGWLSTMSDDMQQRVVEGLYKAGLPD